MRIPNLFIWPWVLTPKVIMTNLLPRQDAFAVIKNLQEEYKISNQNVVFFQERPDYTIPLDDAKILTIKDMLPRGKTIIPQNHVYSHFHYQYIYSRYEKLIPYHIYCGMEENIALEIRSLLSNHQRNMIVFQDESWFYDESLESYLKEDEKNEIHTCLIVDLDVAPHLNIIPTVNEKRFLWTRGVHSVL